MRNAIINLNIAEAEKIKQEMNKNTSFFLVELNGIDIQSWEEYISTIEEKMKFPSSCIDSIDRYLDWIRDLSWLEKDGYTIIIYDSDRFLSEDQRTKNIVLESFEDTVLPWWQEEVKQYMVGGKAKPFNVYLVE